MNPVLENRREGSLSIIGCGLAHLSRGALARLSTSARATPWAAAW